MTTLHIYPHDEPQQDTLIVANVTALRTLAEAMLKVARTPQGFQRVKLHTSDGHEYTAMIVADVSDQEWQNMAPAYRGTVPPQLTILQDYESLRQELAKNN